MLKIQKLSLAALMVSAVVSGSVFAEDKALAVAWYCGLAWRM